MPEARVITIKPQHLLPGDMIARIEGAYVVEARPTIKQKYAYVPIEHTDENEVAELKLVLTEDIAVERMYPTEEEKAQQDRERSNTWIRSQIEALPDLMARYRNRLFDELGMKDASWHGALWAGYANAQQLNTLWTLVADIAFNRGIDYVEAVKIVKPRVQKDILSNVRFTSVSTSAISNLAKGIELEAKAQWLNELEWHVTL